MNFESFYWKKILKRDISYIKKKLNEILNKEPKNLEQIFSTIEIKIFTMAYSLRKLSDTNKVTDDVSNLKVDLLSYKKNNSNFGACSQYHFEKQYNLKKPNQEKLPIRDICNQIIHSYVFFLNYFPTDEFCSIFFNSDKTKNEKLFEIKIQDFLNIVFSFSESYPFSMTTFYCKKEKDFKTICK